MTAPTLQTVDVATGGVTTPLGFRAAGCLHQEDLLGVAPIGIDDDFFA